MKADVAVIGAGAIGAQTAVQLVERVLDVVLIEHGSVGADHAASYGNAAGCRSILLCFWQLQAPGSRRQDGSLIPLVYRRCVRCIFRDLRDGSGVVSPPSRLRRRWRRSPAA